MGNNSVNVITKWLWMNTKIASDGTAQKQPHCYSVDIHRHTLMTANRWRVRARDDDVAEIKSDRPIGAHTHTRSYSVQYTHYDQSKKATSTTGTVVFWRHFTHTHTHIRIYHHWRAMTIESSTSWKSMHASLLTQIKIEPSNQQRIKAKKRPHTTNHLSITFWKLHEHEREFDSPEKFQPVFHVKCQINTYTRSVQRTTDDPFHCAESN